MRGHNTGSLPFCDGDPDKSKLGIETIENLYTERGEAEPQESLF